MLSPEPSLAHTEDSHPILLPGVDSLNHARAHPVSWVVQYPPSTNSEPSIELHVHSITSVGVEVFNNYGPKPNAELLLGYGFTLQNNPDDTIVLKVGGSSAEGRKWEVGRDALGADGLWQEILVNIKSQNIGSNEVSDGSTNNQLEWMCIMDAADLLEEMLTSLLDRLPGSSQHVDGLRPDVVVMISHYIEGQKDILSGLMSFAHQRQSEAVEMARGQGVEVVFE